MSVLLHLDGTPGAGKSRIAEQLVALREELAVRWKRPTDGTAWALAS